MMKSAPDASLIGTFEVPEGTKPAPGPGCHVLRFTTTPTRSLPVPQGEPATPVPGAPSSLQGAGCSGPSRHMPWRTCHSASSDGALGLLNGQRVTAQGGREGRDEATEGLRAAEAVIRYRRPEPRDTN